MASLNFGLKSFIRTVLFAIPVGVTVVDYIGYVAKVEGASMQPCLNPDESLGNADFVYLNKWKVRHLIINRGDVVCLISPRNPGQKLIKRVVGIEGDVIKTLSYKDQYVRIPVGHCWVEGDHRKHSMDSNHFGPVSLNLVTAKASHIVWPWRRIQRLIPRVDDDRIIVKSRVPTQ